MIDETVSSLTKYVAVNPYFPMYYWIMQPKLRSESRSAGDVAAVSPAFSGDKVRGSPSEDFESHVRKTL